MQIKKLALFELKGIHCATLMQEERESFGKTLESLQLTDCFRKQFPNHVGSRPTGHHQQLEVAMWEFSSQCRSCLVFSDYLRDSVAVPENNLHSAAKTGSSIPVEICELCELVLELLTNSVQLCMIRQDHVVAFRLRNRRDELVPCIA